LVRVRLTLPGADLPGAAAPDPDPDAVHAAVVDPTSNVPNPRGNLVVHYDAALHGG
jgi:hypothetical protein